MAARMFIDPFKVGAKAKLASAQANAERLNKARSLGLNVPRAKALKAAKKVGFPTVFTQFGRIIVR